MPSSDSVFIEAGETLRAVLAGWKKERVGLIYTPGDGLACRCILHVSTEHVVGYALHSRSQGREIHQRRIGIGGVAPASGVITEAPSFWLSEASIMPRRSDTAVYSVGNSAFRALEM